MFSQKVFLCAIASALLFTAGCNQKNSNAEGKAKADTEGSIVLLNVTSDYKADPQSVDMAMKLAGFALDEGRTVAFFFNVKGVLLPQKVTSEEFKYDKSDKSLITQLKALIKRGAEVHVCPICMKALNVEKSQLIEGAEETTKPKLFSKIGANTAVFTY